MNPPTGTAGVSPASGNAFTRATGEAHSSADLEFNESGRGARGPSNRLEFLAAGRLGG